jgi:hypothetical protein
MITEDEIRAIVMRDPFVPVRLHMNDGRTFDVWQPYRPGEMSFKKDWLHYREYKTPTTKRNFEPGFVYLPWVERVEELVWRTATNEFAFSFAVTL